ncbi:MAG: hypothetical protein ACI93T_001066 [Porticoccaceae bacterium]|jgi:hypothetical protein
MLSESFDGSLLAAGVCESQLNHLLIHSAVRLVLATK